jgi:hypothetical protein
MSAFDPKRTCPHFADLRSSNSKSEIIDRFKSLAAADKRFKYPDPSLDSVRVQLQAAPIACAFRHATLPRMPKRVSAARLAVRRICK